MEHVRRQMALLQQQTLLSTDQVGQQMSWLRQQMHSLVTQVSSQGQDQAENDTAWELDALQRQLQQSMSVLQFLEDKLYMVQQNMHQQPVPPQVPPPAAPFPYGMPFPPTSPFPFGVPGALEPLPAGIKPPVPGRGLKEQPRPLRSAPPRSAAAPVRPGPLKSRLPAAASSLPVLQQQPPNGQHQQATRPKPARTFWKSIGPLRPSDQLAKSLKEPSAYDFFSAKAHADIEADNPGTALSDVADKLRELWDHATPQQKKPFEEMARAERERMRAQQARWITSHAHTNGSSQPAEKLTSKAGQASKPDTTPRHAAPQTHAENEMVGGAAAPGGRTASAASPSAPSLAQTAPLTAFQLFSAARYPEVLRQNSSLLNLTQPDTPSAGAAHILGAQWNVSSKEEKEHWHAEAKKQLLKAAGEAEGMDSEEDDKDCVATESEDNNEPGGPSGMQDAGCPSLDELYNEVVQPHGPHMRTRQVMSNGRQRFISPAMLQKTYCFPRDKAAKYLNVSVNLLKRICRDNHIERWPYRKLQSLDHLIKNAQEQASADPKGAKEIIDELQRLKLEIYANPDLELDDRVKKLRQVNYKNDYRQRCHSDRHEHPGRNSRKQPPPPADMEGAMVAAFASMQEQDQELDQMQDDEQQDEKEEQHEQCMQHEQEQAWEREHGELQQQLLLQQGHQEEQQQQEAQQQEEEAQRQEQEEQQQEQEEQRQKQEEQRQQQELQQQQQQQQSQGKGDERQGQPLCRGSKPVPGPGCNLQDFQASAEQGLFGVPQAAQHQQQKEHRSSSPPTRAPGNASLRSRNTSKGSINRSRTPSFDGTSSSLALGKQGGAVPSAADEILPRAGSGVPGHSSFQSTLQGTFGGDFVSEDGCIDGQPYEPEMVIRLNTGGEERTLKRSMLARVFHLPIQAAADSLNMGQTWLKKICRDFAIERWPYRKLQSLDHLIRSVEEQSISDPVGANDIIRELRQIKKEIYSNPDAKLDDKIKRLRQANYKLEYKQRHNDSSPMTLGNGAGGGGTSGPIEKQRSQQPGGASLQYAMAQAHAQLLVKKREQEAALGGPLQEASAMLKQGKMPTMEQLQVLMQYQQQQQRQQEPQQQNQVPASEQQWQQQQLMDPQGLPVQLPPQPVESGPGQELLKQLGLPGMEVGRAVPGQPQLGMPNPLLAGCPPQVPQLDQEALLKSLLGGLSSPAAGGFAPLAPDLLQGVLAPLPTGSDAQPQQPAAAAAAAAAAQPGSSSNSSSQWAALGLPLSTQDLLQPTAAVQPPLQGQGKVKGEAVPLQVPESLQPLLASLQPLSQQQQQQQQQGEGSTVPQKGMRSRRRRRQLPLPFLVQNILGKGAFAHASAGEEEQRLQSQQPQQRQQQQQQHQEQPYANASIASPALPCHEARPLQGEGFNLVPSTKVQCGRTAPSEPPLSHQPPPPQSVDSSDAGGLGVVNMHAADRLQGAGAPQHQGSLLSQLPASSQEAVPIAPAALPQPSFEVPKNEGSDPFPWAPASLLPQLENEGQEGIYGTRQVADLLQQQQQQQQQQEEDELLGLFIQDPPEHQQPQQGVKRSRESDGVGAGAAEAAKHYTGKTASVGGGEREHAWGSSKHARIDAAHLLL